MGRVQVVHSLAAVVALALPLASGAQEGVWWTPKRDAKIEIARGADGILSGRIIAGRPQTPQRVDEKNPDPALRTRRLLGLGIMTGFKPDPKDATQWIDGRVYDPDNGMTYRARLWMEGGDRLLLRGFLGVPMFGRTEVFTKVAGPNPRRQQAGEPEFMYVSD